MQYIKFDSIKEEGTFKTLNEFDLGMLPDIANKITDIAPPPPSNNAPKTTASTPTLVSSNTPKK